MTPLWIITAGALTLLHNAGAPPVTPAWSPGANTITVGSIDAARASGTGWKAMVADVEKWPPTPTWQQHHPVRAIRAICRIAHSRHEQCIAAPALDLFGGDPSRYLAWHVARAARFADVFEIQAQSLELQPAAYARFVRHAAAQARAAHPGVIVLAGLTTDSRHGHVTGPALWAAYTSVRGSVGGYWANVPGGPSKWCPACGAANPWPMVYLLRRAAS